MTANPKRPDSREEEAGFTLVTVIISLLLIGSFTMMIVQVTLARGRSMTASIRWHQEQLDRASAIAVLTPQIGETLLNAQEDEAGPLALDGTRAQVLVRGRMVGYALQDIEALPDLYLTNLSVFETLFDGHPVLNADNVRLFRRDVPRGAVRNVEQALLAMAPDADGLTELAGWVSITSADGRVNVARIPGELRAQAEQRIRGRRSRVVVGARTE